MSSFSIKPVEANAPELLYNRDDLDQIRKVYVKKAPYLNKKNGAYETKNVEVGSAKRNIQRSGGNTNHKTGNHVVGGKKKYANNLVDDGSTYEYYNDNMDEHDPNFDSEVVYLLYLCRLFSC